MMNCTANMFSIKTTLMIACIKMHYIGLCYKDAGLVAEGKAEQAKLTPREIKYAEPLKEKLSLMQFLQYFCFVGTVIMGPSIEYRDFHEFINLQGDFAKMPITSSVLPAFKRLGHVLCLLVLTILAPLFHDYHYVLTEPFSNEPFPLRVYYLSATLLVLVIKFFVGFCLAECCLIASGQGYSISTTTDNKGKSTDIENHNSI